MQYFIQYFRSIRPDTKLAIRNNELEIILGHSGKFIIFKLVKPNRKCM